MKQYRYSWTKHFGVPAQVVGEWLYALPERSADAVLEAAKNRKSPVYGLFDWDDSSAARKYRLAQACSMINSLEVQILTPENKTKRISAYIRSIGTDQYVPTLEASDEDLSLNEKRCWSEMSRFKIRWKNLQFAREVISAIQHAEMRITRTRKRKAA